MRERRGGMASLMPQSYFCELGLEGLGFRAVGCKVVRSSDECLRSGVLGFQGLRFGDLGFRVLGFQGLGFQGLGCRASSYLPDRTCGATQYGVPACARNFVRAQPCRTLYTYYHIYICIDIYIYVYIYNNNNTTLREREREMYIYIDQNLQKPSCLSRSTHTN